MSTSDNASGPESAIGAPDIPATVPADGPVLQNDRYVVMDVVRGFALFGVLAANMRSFNAPLLQYDHIGKLFPGRLDVIAQTLLDIFISGKFYTLFAFLFGLGFAVQMSRAQSRSAGFPWFYLRRLAALALFGLVHGILIWNGDILFAYAIGGFWLLWFRKAKLKTVRRWAISLWSIALLALFCIWLWPHVHHTGHAAVPAQPKTADISGIIATYAHARVAGVVKETALLWTGSNPPSRGHPFMWLGSSFLPEDASIGTASLLLFLLGLWVWRQGILQDLARYQNGFRRVCAFALPCGLALAVVATIGQKYLPQGSQPSEPPPSLAALLVNYALVLSFPVLACGYATLLAGLFLSDRWRPRILWLAPLGRMALTNYLMQSVLCVAFFTGITTGLYGRVGPAWDWIATIVLYTAQVFFSRWWLAHFQFGPVEWLWRTLTYMRPAPMRVHRV